MALESITGDLAKPQEGREAGRWRRVFSKEGVNPFDEVEWKLFHALIKRPNGEVVFEQRDVEFPAWWDQRNVDVVADKYFRVVNGVKERSLKQIINRVCKTIRMWAESQDYFNTPKDGEVYEAELAYALLHHYGAFNSPVWFNLGVPGRKQTASACFISGVEDSLDAIMEFGRSEKVIFASGSGSGANMSDIRSSYEKLSSGAYVCGPIGWMEELDKGAKAMKSGGSTRNAAKMVVMDMDHPDIMKTKDGRPGFIVCKAVEEKRAHDLIDIGYSASYDDPNSAYKWVSFQNANHSVSISDAFMQAVEADGKWETRERTTGKIVTEYRARDLWKEISQAAWFCGDPGVQFTDTINKWHTTPENGRIKSSNPCSEFLHVDNTACNLCAINLTRFFDDEMKFLPARLEHAVRVFVTAQNAIISRAEYPTEKIRENSHALRPIGLNYGDLGALLMKLGLSYDSDEGRAVAARLASLMTGNAYLTSARLAARVGAFPEFEKNRSAMLNVMSMHTMEDASILHRWNLEEDPLGSDVVSRSDKLWDEVYRLGDRFGYTISQATLQAPLGTISFLMDMDTTGIEPSFGLVSYKSLVGGGFMKMVNRVVPKALKKLGYTDQESKDICSFLEKEGHLEGAPHLSAEDLRVFLCAMPSGPSKSCLTPKAHLEMMAAIQPLITCAQSKTVNMASDATPEDIADTYMLGWKLGLKCIALYRDGSKKSQPLSTKKEEKKEASPSPSLLRDRRPMPDDRNGITHRFEIGGHDGYITVSNYPDGKPGEVFIRLGKNGSTMAGLTDGFTKLLSVALQYGVPLDKLIPSFTGMRFEPSGTTRNPNIRFADSLFDYLFKFLDIKYYDGECSGIGSAYAQDSKPISEPPSSPKTSVRPTLNLDGPPCANCGTITRRNGSCYLCSSCGTTTGCS